MFGSTVLDVALGLAFVFLFLSLICSAANELLELMLKKRARDLERGIIELLGAPDETNKFIAAIYNHGLINSLYRGQYSETPKWKLPSYIPARNFALALQDVYNLYSAKQGEVGISVIPANVESAFQALTKEAAGDANKLQNSIENWYNSAMDRVSGWYKRRSQIFIFIIGAAAAIGVNADCIEISKRLSNDASLRQGVVALAEAAAKKDQTKNDNTKPVDVITDNLKTLEAINLPIGWPADPNLNVSPEQRFIYAVANHWLGWLLTTLAVSLGAPFWFDVLNKIIVVRSTVKPHEKSSEEPSKDAK